MVMKHARTRDIYLLLKDILKLLVDYPLPILTRDLACCMYLMQEGDCQDGEQFFSYVIEHTPQYGEEIMSLAQRLKLEGEQGIMRRSVLNMLNKGLSSSEIINYTGFEASQVLEIIKNKDTDIKI